MKENLLFVILIIAFVLLAGCTVPYSPPVDKTCSVDSDCAVRTVGCSGCGMSEVYGCANKQVADLNCSPPAGLLIPSCAPMKPDYCSCVSGVCTDKLWLQPYESAYKTIKEYYTRPGEMATVEKVKIYYDFSFQSANQVPPLFLQSEEVCLSLGDFEGDQNVNIVTEEDHYVFKSGGGFVEIPQDQPGRKYQKIKWSAGQKIIELIITCNNSKDALEQSLKGTIFEERNWKYDCSICEGQEKCCIVALKKPS